jgi:proliferating cell nuclear antigen
LAKKTKKTTTKKKEKPKKPKKACIQATLKSPEKIQKIFDVISQLVDDVSIRFGKSGVLIDTMDSSHVGMLHVDLPRGYFLDYVNRIGPVEWGIGISDITKIIKRGAKKDKIEFYREEGDGMKGFMQVRIIRGKKRRTFSLPNKSVEDYTFDKEGLDLQEQILGLKEAVEGRICGTIIPDTKFFMDIIKDAMIVDEIINFKLDATKDTLELFTEDTAGDMSAVLDLKETYVKKAKILEDAESSYSLIYIESLLKLQPIVEHFELNFGQYTPLLVKCKFLKDEEKLAVGDPGTFTYMLAPRVKDDLEDDEEDGEYEEANFDEDGEDSEVSDEDIEEAYENDE